MRFRTLLFNINCRFFTVNSNKQINIKKKKSIYKKNENTKFEPLINTNLNLVYFSPYTVHPIRKNEYYKKS
jgi:hypothetical protein